MTKKKYKARKGSKFQKKDAQVIGETIEKLKEKKGYVKTEDIVESARIKKSPLHKYFEWDNSKAAQKYRLQQARGMISSVVEVIVVSEEKVEQRSFFSVTAKTNGNSEKVYVTLKDAVETTDYRKQLLNQAITTLENLTITMKMFRQYDTH